MTTIDYTYFERAFFRYEGLQIDCLIYDCAFIDFMKPVSTSLNQNQKCHRNVIDINGIAEKTKYDRLQRMAEHKR